MVHRIKTAGIPLHGRVAIAPTEKGELRPNANFPGFPQFPIAVITGNGRGPHRFRGIAPIFVIKRRVQINLQTRCPRGFHGRDQLFLCAIFGANGAFLVKLA